MCKHNSFGWPIATGLLVCFTLTAPAQDPETASRSTPNSKTDSIVSSLEKIQSDFAQHIEKEKEMLDEYRELETKLKKTESELQRVNVQGMQQQLAAMQSAMQSMQLNANLRILAAGNTPGNAPGNSNTAVRDFAQMQLMQNRFLQNLESSLRANELLQLDANAQAIVRTRLETLQATVQLQQQWLEWQSKGSQFYARYWPWCDPEGRFSASELAAALAVLEKRHEKDHAAKLIAANLLVRLGRHAEALSLIEEVLEVPTELQGVATMEKSKALFLLDKDKESKQSLQAAIKMDKGNPYLRWLRAEIAMLQDQDSTAETEFRFLSTVKQMEKEARRSLALVHAKRSKKSPGEGNKAIKEAKAALDLETVPDWYSHFVMATAYAAGRKWELAMESMDKAISMADDEQRDRCEKQKEEWEPVKQ